MKLDATSYNALLPKTADLLRRCSELDLFNSYTLVGGSGLALYLSHRLSEDLDFFTWEKTIDKALILEVLQTNFTDITLITDTNNQQDWIVEGVKLTFCAKNWDILRERTLLENNIYVASLELITATKVSTLFVRAKYRDYYDLYAVAQIEIFTIDMIYKCAETRIINMNRRLFEAALVYTDDIETDNISYLNPKYKITKKQIGAFFAKKIKKWA